VAERASLASWKIWQAQNNKKGKKRVREKSSAGKNRKSKFQDSASLHACNAGGGGATPLEAEEGSKNQYEK